jgi:hypothetical protein
VTLNAVDDAYVAGDLPSNNFGSAAELDSDLSPIRESYLKFDLRSLTNLTISGATLRMYVTSGSSNTQNIKQVANNTWTEGTINYTNKPPSGATVTTFLQPSANAWNEVNITSAVAASAGAFMSLAMDNSGSDGYRFSSDEAATNRVELVVSWSGGPGGPTPTPTPVPTVTPTPAPTPTPGPTPPPGGSFSFGAVGDHGQNSNTTAVLNAAAAANMNFFISLGDNSYAGANSETAWCNFVKSGLGNNNYPFELVAGNHEDDGPDGLITNYAACLPHRLTPVTGVYAKEYYYDYPATNPLARFINISAGLTFPGEGTYSYAAGSPRYNWTANAIDQARTAGIKYVIVSTHIYCISLVSGSCQANPDIMNLLVSKKVDLYLQAHDHAYARSKQLAHRTGCTAISPGSFNANCVVDSDNQFVKGAGTVIVTSGAGGQSINSQSASDPEAGYFATFMGSNANPTYGFLKVSVSNTSLSAQFVRGAGGNYTDSFTIQ